MNRPTKQTIYRRQSPGLLAGAAGLLAARPTMTLLAQEAAAQSIVIDPMPRFELSPFLYMRFMEPLGATDASVDAAWDHPRDYWREDVLRGSGCVHDSAGHVTPGDLVIAVSNSGKGETHPKNPVETLVMTFLSAAWARSRSRST